MKFLLKVVFAISCHLNVDDSFKLIKKPNFVILGLYHGRLQKARLFHNKIGKKINARYQRLLHECRNGIKT